MAQFNSDSYEGMSSLPTNSHGGMVMAHRSLVKFPVETVLAIGDKLVMGVLPEGYTIDSVSADSDGFAGLSVDVVQADSLDVGAVELSLAAGISLATAGRVNGAMTMNAVRYQGSDQRKYIVAKVAAGGTVTAGKEIGLTIQYRYRQVTY